MSKINLEDLGFTKEELLEKVLERICAKVLTGISFDEDGNEMQMDSTFSRNMDERVKQHIDATINTIAEKSVLPNVSTYIENLTLEKTNQWGERKGEKFTFIEYLVSRAEAYMLEKVNFQGKSEAEDSYSWRGAQTRITYMVNSHLQYSIEVAMKQALTTANEGIAKGLEETIKLKLAEIAQTLAVSATFKS